MLGAILTWIYHRLGWKIVGPHPTVPKALWVVAPHSTNWDFPIGLWIRHEVGSYVGFLAKSSLFTWYGGWFFRALGGTPVYRDKANNLVDAVADTFNRHKVLHICITPEGTRSDVSKLKTGFYYMAQKANVPMILVGFDWTRKTIVLSKPLYVTGDYQRDMLPFYEFFASLAEPHKTWLRNWEKTGEIPNPVSVSAVK
ncbi:1-acyl-sn-glycerol-3-phosphate acyltransferase [Fibrella forsythiae]|uniref:1-acyl-sn-glycerol-3-phosphate acyltransferase n=1 Tax=Fibrella forsythiae TaxID=2817061 RepID=A0ABS3JL64_9BACT|nr:1-acyl-sn-glycerol-3-phosphate acyltransferase [Fibrella forsythiae]MBO0950756.1 1-acyl-sn-glycerol-3-phosphate acyltransferase [Fibrella forsythiae]